MANFHLNSKVGSRKGGQSATAKASYILREGKYKKAEPPAFSLSGNMPTWAKPEPMIYWNAAQKNERANGTLFRGVEFGLPLELDVDQRQKLAEDFCQDLAKWQDSKMPYTLAIHDDVGNPHCHFMMSERANDGIDRSADLWFKKAQADPKLGGARKLNIGKVRKEWLMSTRKKWEVTCNSALRKHGHNARIDHRSNIDRGIHKPPEVYNPPHKKLTEKQKKRRQAVSDAWHFNKILGQNQSQRSNVRPTYTREERMDFMFERIVKRVKALVSEGSKVSKSFAQTTSERIYFTKDIVPVNIFLGKISKEGHSTLSALKPDDLKAIERFCSDCVKIHNNIKDHSPIVFKEFGKDNWEIFKNRVKNLRTDITELKPPESKPKKKQPSLHAVPTTPNRPKF